MKNRLIRVRNFVYKHRVAFAILGTAITFMVINYRNSKIIDEFLTQHGIDPNDFWCPEA